MANNPYSPPTAEVSDITVESEEFQPIKLWSAQGRIGRLRYVAYITVGTFVSMFVGGILGALLIPAIGRSGILFAYLPFVVFSFLTLIKRSHDMNWSGWTVLAAAFIPFAGLIWLFKAGTKGENDYGSPPPPNTTAVKVFGYLSPLLLVAWIGILAAIAIPAYQKYVQRAHAAQEHMQQQTIK